MTRRAIVPLTLAVALALGACGSNGSAKVQSAPDTTSLADAANAANAQRFSSPSYEPAGPNPSKSAKMVCSEEAREDIAASLGVKDTSVTKPTWRDHMYSCTYVYPRGKLVLHVKELVNATTTTNYFNAIKKKYGTTQKLIGLGQGAWILKNNGVVVRKDYKVLVVDVSGIPPKFVRTMVRSDVAVNVAAAIMGCWVGD